MPPGTNVCIDALAVLRSPVRSVGPAPRLSLSSFHPSVTPRFQQTRGLPEKLFTGEVLEIPWSRRRPRSATKRPRFSSLVKRQAADSPFHAVGATCRDAA
jgi:hypothetical protein